MSPLPTSLIVVGLVAAWLVVLVPMVAKRREHVPESDEDSAGFRVLHGASRSLRRRRPVLSRTAVAAEPEDRYLDGDEREWDSDEWDEAEQDPEGDEVTVREDEASEGEDFEGDAEFDGAEFARDGFDGDGLDGDGLDGDDVGGDGSHRGKADLVSLSDSADRADDPRPRRAPVAAVEQPMLDDRWSDIGDARHRPAFADAADEWEAEHRDARAAARQRYDERRYGRDERVDRAARDARADGDYRDDGRDEAQFRPVPIRPGRGGFDPRAAERAKAFRYRQRRRIVLLLLALAVVGAALGVLGIGMAWAGSAVAFVLLVLYLAYLRRQVRIEETIRQRRAARLERARQIRPVYRASVAEQVRAHRSGALRRPEPDEEPVATYQVRSHARPTSTVPPPYYTRGVPVDLDDDDPAFDDLEYYRPVTYRRAVGE